MSNRFNKHKYPGAKRLMLEAQELSQNTEDYCAQPIDDNLFEWHFTVRGPPDTAFDGGYYHGRLSFPTDYPMKPPSIILLTPNGRFKTNQKICLSISGYHPETWQPSWSVRTALLALIAFMPTKANGAIGSLDFSDSERKKLALKSRSWRCETCGLIRDLLVHPSNGSPDQRCSSSNENAVFDANESSVAGTSRVKEQSLNEGDSEEENKAPSDSDSETSTNSPSPDKSELGDESVQAYRSEDQSARQGIGQSSQSDERTNQISSGLVATTTTNSSILDQSRINANHSPQSQELNGRQDRTFSPLILRAIFVTLLLLILRRIVMVVQS